MILVTKTSDQTRQRGLYVCIWSSHIFSLSVEMSRLTRDGTVEPVSRDHTLRHVRGEGNTNFPCSADHEQDWQLTRLIHTLFYVIIHTYIVD